ncbi:MAG TPA: DUF1697 domain-containing protein [Vicinamibacterales bacterium]|nr:DUF1697 domain-containing protein [Vicinamibacterales bacterium]
MPRYVALLRAVNVGGRGTVTMSDLRALVESLGYRDVTTVLNSGNVVFAGPSKSTDAIEKQLETAAKHKLGLDTPFVVRSGDALRAAITKNPFRKEADTDPGRLIVLFAKSDIAGSNVKALQSAIVGRETVRGGGRHVYAFYPDGQGRSKVTVATIEKKLGVRVTGRNWNTVLKLKELVCG